MRAKAFFRKAGIFFCTKEIFEDKVLSIRFYKYFLIGLAYKSCLPAFLFPERCDVHIPEGCVNSL